MSVRCLVEDAFYIAWGFLEKSGELGDPDASANILLDSIQHQLRTGERRTLLLANRAISAYREQAAFARVSSRKETSRG
ncbi:hypothetical protein JQ596_12090 [Bradyrhizobium manausense]|uniref:hypothetical protein n=1 Tax=Bradyrhizobium TaxID=374 RepID=UPI001BA793F3|nr:MULTISPECIES: hypothetical protein [Bradyrhizobium]MBR0826281.1 hypothetical protein [Bradyrhizobium manausense]UVO33226.1 hypothetical protein KUF59_14345 [Bradyrhizobium arachidis]